MKTFLFTPGALGLALLATLAGCVPGPMAAAPAAPVAAATQPAASAQQPAAAQPAAPAAATPGTTPAAAGASLSGQADLYGAPFVGASVTVLPLAGATAAQRRVLATGAAIATGTTNADGTFTVTLPETVSPTQPVQLVIRKAGTTITRILRLQDRGRRDVTVGAASTLAVLMSRLNTLGAAFVKADGRVADLAALDRALAALDALTEQTRQALAAPGATAYRETIVTRLAADGSGELTSGTARSLAAQLSGLTTAFTALAGDLVKALESALAAGGTDLDTTSLTFGSQAVNLTTGATSTVRSGGGGSSSQPPVTPTPITLDGTLELPTQRVEQ